MSKNDDRILELKEKIEEKKQELSGKNTKFVPVTNCIIELDGMTNNLHTCDSDKLALLLVKLNLYKKEAENLDIDFVISGYSIDELTLQKQKQKYTILKQWNQNWMSFFLKIRKQNLRLMISQLC